MKNAVKILVSMVIVAMICGCSMSPEDIGKTVQSSMQNKFNSDANFREHNLLVDNVQVFKKGGKNYKGMAAIIYKGSSYNVSVEIIADGKNVMWETEPGAFVFIAREQLRNLF